MKENEPKLNPKQEKAIVALLTEPTIGQAADKAGVGETTLYRWMKEEAFDEAFKDARKKALDQTISQTQEDQGTTIEVILLGLFDFPFVVVLQVDVLSRCVE